MKRFKAFIKSYMKRRKELNNFGFQFNTNRLTATQHELSSIKNRERLDSAIEKLKS